MDFLPLLLVQIAVIITAARAVGFLFRRIHQPQVVGEMTAGLLLGPSLLGWLAPGVSATLFPVESLIYLNVLSQIGLVLFMFLVGLEFEPALLRDRGHVAVVTSHASITVPFMLGAGLALYLYPRLSDESVPFIGFALFLGTAMSITAFPVLARILSERNLLRTRLGSVTIACAAVDDVSAWTILAIVVAVVRAGAPDTALLLTILGSIAYVALVLALVRPALRFVERLHRRRGRLTADVLALVLVVLLLSAWTTESLGIHALFGAFFMGAVMPKERDFVRDLRGRLEDITVILLLPLFFAFTGLRTSVGLLAEPAMWLFLALVIAVAVTGKFGGSALAARLTGLSWRDAGALGVLMNTRGLMELVILSIGYDLGLISPALFAMMVLMALVTTFMTTPILAWLYPASLIRREAIGDPEHARFDVLVPVSTPSSGVGLLAAAAAFTPHDRPARIYPLYLVRAAEQSLTEIESPDVEGEAGVFGPLLESARARELDVRPLTLVSRDIAADITGLAHAKGAELVVMGWHKPIGSRRVLRGTLARVGRGVRSDLAVLVERRPPPWQRILVPFEGGPHGERAFELALRAGRVTGADVTVLAPHDMEPALLRSLPDPPRVLHRPYPVEAAAEELADYDLVMVGAAVPPGAATTPLAGPYERLVQAKGPSVILVRAWDPDISRLAVRHEARLVVPKE